MRPQNVFVDLTKHETTRYCKHHTWNKTVTNLTQHWLTVVPAKILNFIWSFNSLETSEENKLTNGKLFMYTNIVRVFTLTLTVTSVSRYRPTQITTVLRLSSYPVATGIPFSSDPFVRPNCNAHFAGGQTALATSYKHVRAYAHVPTQVNSQRTTAALS